MRASDRAYETLREEILDGALVPGTVLAEVEQSTRLGVSRTPLREALSRLVADGLIVAQSGRGVVVTDLAAADIRDLYELREALEEQAAELAAARRDPAPFESLHDRLTDAPDLLERGEQGLADYYALIADLDDAIDTAMANSYLGAALRSVRLHSSRIRRLARHDPERLRTAAGEHLLIVEAIIAGDVALAGHATHVHLHKSLRHALASIDGRAGEGRTA
jgi:DNA-binding GntR family transcriptional regulator